MRWNTSMCGQDGRVSSFLQGRAEARLPSWPLLPLPPGRWHHLVTSGWGVEVLALYKVPSDTTPEKSQRGGLPAWWGWKPSLPTWSPLDMGVLRRPQLLRRDDRTCRGEGRWKGSWGQEEV